MSHTMYGYCGSVTQDGQITSNGNYSCQYSGNEYTISYNGSPSDPIPVVSLTGPTPGMTYVLNAYTGGFKLYVYDSNLVPVATSFTFIVAKLA